MNWTTQNHLLVSFIRSIKEVCGLESDLLRRPLYKVFVQELYN